MDSEAPQGIGRDNAGRLLHPSAAAAFPVGLLGGVVVFDGVALLGGGETMAVVAYRMLAVGLIGAAAVAVFGRWRARRFGQASTDTVISGDADALSGLRNTALSGLALLLFAASWAVRRVHDGLAPPLALGLSFAGAGLALLLIRRGRRHVVAPSTAVTDDNQATT